MFKQEAYVAQTLAIEVERLRDVVLSRMLADRDQRNRRQRNAQYYVTLLSQVILLQVLHIVR
jgi:hypothetical protein